MVLVGFHGLHGSFMVSHSFWMISMVFQGSFMVFGWFPWFFKVVSWFLMVSGWFPLFFKVVSWFLVGLHGFSRYFRGFHGFWLVSMVSQGSFMVWVGFNCFSR